MHKIDHLVTESLISDDITENSPIAPNAKDDTSITNINVLSLQQYHANRRIDNLSSNKLYNVANDINNKLYYFSRDNSCGGNKVITQQKNVRVTIEDLRLLVVEDNSIAQKVVSLMLNALGYQNIKIVETGQQAIEEFNRNKYDLVILDIGLPDINGFDISKAMRKSSENSQAKIIAATAFNRDEIRQQCYLSGFNDIITKPIFIDELKSVLDLWLELRA